MKKQLQTTWILLLFLLLQFSVKAQFQDGLWTGKQAYNWYFGDNAGLNFNTSPPTPLTNGAYNGTFELNEGGGAISNSSGELLFYSDGITIWNKNHQIMENGEGLYGCASTSQSGLIVPIPNNENLYYIFTSDDLFFDGGNPGINDGLTYSVIDMSLDNGLGAVTENKNIMIDDGVSEKLTAIYDSTGDKLWVVSHKNDKFISFLIDENGINETPVISQTGDLIFNDIGQMKISPNGNKIAYINGVLGSNPALKIFDFNKNTGEVSNEVDLISSLPDISFLSGYGIEFSPNSRFLYVLPNRLGNIVKILQYDLLNYNQNDIINSMSIVGEVSSQFDALQLGPDGKIYISNYNQTQLHIINFPNNLSNSCGFELNAIDLNGRENGYGFPSFIQSYFKSGILHEGECPNQEISFSTLRIPGIESINWNYGDGQTGNGLTPTHIYEQIGTYTVTATITSNGAEQTATTEVTIIGGAEATQPDDLIACEDENGNGLFILTDQDNVILDGQDAATYTVSYYTNEADALNANDAIQSADSYTSAGETVYARVTNTGTGCYAITSFKLVVNPTPVLPSVMELSGCPPFNLAIATSEADENLSLSYYAEEADAEAGTNAIAQPQNYYIDENEVNVYVRAVNPEGCVEVASLELKRVNCEIPKGISPNGDGINDSFDLGFLTANAGGASIQIFSRYGRQVYEQGNYTDQWSGQDQNGGQLPTGTYYYVLNLNKENPDFGKTIKRWVYLQNNK